MQGTDVDELGFSHIRVHADVQGRPKVPSPVWTSLKASMIMALVSFPQGTDT